MDRGEFFASLPELLKQERGVSEVHPLPDAYVPLLKLKVNDIPVCIYLIGHVLCMHVCMYDPFLHVWYPLTAD